MKAAGYPGKDRRQFFRHPHEKPVHYKKLSLTRNKILASKLTDAVSKNLSTSGVLFITQDPPELSSIVILDFDHRGIKTFHREIKNSIFMLNHKVFGKVVRIEDSGNGQYHVGVAFIEKTESTVNIIEDLLTKGGWHNLAVYCRRGLLLLLVILGTLSLNVIYLEPHKLYIPDRGVVLSPTSVGMLFEDLNFKAEDGESINGWFVPAKGGKVTILYCHGNSGNITDRLSRIDFFNKMGFNLLIFDYRGYGKSSGKPSEQGLYKDARAAYDYLISRNDIDKDKIIALGVSLGGAVAAELCLKRKVRALVLESTFVSLTLQAQDLYPYLPVGFLLWEKYDTLSKIKKIGIPKLIIHGIDDEIVLFKHARLLYDAAPSPKVFLPFEGGHDDNIFKLSEAYKNKLTKFLLDYQIA